MFKEITKNNLNEITNLFIEVFNGEPWYDKWTYETAIKRLRDIIDMPGFIGNAYYEDNTLVGCIMGREEMFYDGKHFEILKFYVNAKCQGKGYGRKILNDFTYKLFNKDIKKIFLITCHGIRTEGFYEKNGFKTSEELIIMSKNIL